MTTIYDNSTSSDRSTTTRVLAQIIITGVIITVIIALMMRFYVGSLRAATDAKKLTELSGLYTKIVDYYLDEGTAPANHSDQSTCIIGEFYDNKKCLRELARDGYGAPPISPDDEPYYYYEDESMFYVATRLSKALPESQKCPYEDDRHVWCKSFEKN